MSSGSEAAAMSWKGPTKASKIGSAATSRTGCPDLLAKDVTASRAVRQPEGASQSGSPWIPLDALLLRTTEQRRDFMLKSIRTQLEARHSTFDLHELDRVLGVMRKIDREKFLPRAQKPSAYLPLSLDIGFCQTLSDAYIIALMTSAARVQPNDNVLDVGTGSGYQAAILSRLARHVQSLEIVPQLALQARRRLKHMGYRNVDVAMADGYAGWPERAPFDVILVTAGSTAIPQPLLDQLKPGGRLIMPLGPTMLEEELVLAVKSQTGAVTRCTLGLAAFVPMTGQAQITDHRFTANVASGARIDLPQCFAVPVS
jgi:protein-L-isoaspartate(D-aspartate) O-methyltransferase